jgi:hypothetical protein
MARGGAAKPLVLDMGWNRSEALSLADPRCRRCLGLGASKAKPCGCVKRQIFRACWREYCAIQAAIGKHRGVSYDKLGCRGSSRCFGRKNEEYLADFWLIAKRTLRPLEWRVFDAHFLQGLEYSACCKLLDMDRGNFFHAVYRVQEKLGVAFRATKPYSLFPLHEYFTQ